MENIESTFVPKALVLMYIPLGLITFHISFFFRQRQTDTIGLVNRMNLWKCLA